MSENQKNIKEGYRGLNVAQAPSTRRNQLGERLSQDGTNTYMEPLSQALGDRWNAAGGGGGGLQSAAPPPPLNDAERFSVELERVSARLLDLSGLLAKRLSFYTRAAGGSEGEKAISGSVYNSSYFEGLGNLTDSMRLSLNLIEAGIENLEI